MSTIYNPLSGQDSFLTEFGASGIGNGISPESAPSVLNVGSGSAIGDALSGAASNALEAFNPGNVLGVPTGLPSLSRIVAILLGLILIVGGIIMFRPEVGEAVRDAAIAG